MTSINGSKCHWKSISLVVCLFVYVVSTSNVRQENVRPKLYVELGSEDIMKFQGNDTVVDYFRLVLRDGNSLLVGARNTVYNLSISDFTEQRRLVWHSPENDVKMCVMKGKDDESCQNYIRILAQPSGDKLLVCGTNSFRPMCHLYLINATSYTLETEKSGQAIVPYDPQPNSTAVYVGK